MGGLEMVEVDGADPGHAILFGQQDLRGDVPDGRGDGGDGDLAQAIAVNGEIGAAS
jgi:hypothetical protein